MEITNKYLIISTFLLLFLTACNSDIDCLTANSVEKIKVVKVENKNYFVYLKVTGFHDKVAFFELYDSEPLFDICGISDTSPISSEMIDPDINLDKENVSKVLFYPKNSELKVIYSEEQVQESFLDHLKKIRIEIKK